MTIFNEYAYYYDVFYQEKDYKAEATVIDSLLKQYGEAVSKVINFGCGTGKHDIELTKLGYKCCGIDLSPVMIEMAKRTSEEEKIEIDFSVADIRNYEPCEQYDAVISLFHVMSYQTKNQDILKAFQSARKALRAGGIFLFDVWYGPGVLSDKPAVRTKEIERGNDRILRIAKPVMYDKENITDVNYEILVIDKEKEKVKCISEAHRMRYFFRPELELMLGMTGFEILGNLDCDTLGETDFRSWTSYVIARAV